MRDRRKIPANKFTLTDIEYTDRIADNFYISELVKSETAVRLGIKNWFRTDQQLRNAVHLTRSVLQPLRELYGPFTPHSVYRSQALERILKKKPADWVSRSQHTLGEAADIEIPGISNYDLIKSIIARIDFDQAILEMYEKDRPDSGWVHVSSKFGTGNRKQILTFDGKISTSGLSI